MNKKLTIAVSFVTLLTLPLAAMAISPGGIPNAFGGDITGLINTLLNFVWPIFVGFAVIMFLVAGFMFLTAQGDAAKIAAARQALLWGIVGVVVGLLAFSIPFIVRNTIGV